MRVSLKWLQQFVHLPDEAASVGDALTRTGLEVEGQESFRNTPDLSNLVIGKVLNVRPHPNADHLHITQVDVGDDTKRQIVCGAPNVDAGQHVVVALPGTTLSPYRDEPIKIKKGKIRGEVSEGMICAEDEIGVGERHEGIMVLPQEAPVGQTLEQYWPIYEDTVFEIGLTPNRVDAANHLGVARDLSAWFRHRLCHPEEAELPPPSSYRGPAVSLEAPRACPRYAGLYFPKVNIIESPEWMRYRLEAIGITPRNIWVDTTNYVMHELGQPLHAFDADRIGGHKLRIRMAAEGEKLTTLEGTERHLRPADLVIADEARPLALAGILGGKTSGVCLDTDAIFLESAYFDPVGIRKSARHFQLATDAAFRFERGADPQAASTALARALHILRANGAFEGKAQFTDHYPEPLQPLEISFDPAYVDRIAGQAINRSEMKEIMEFLEFGVEIHSHHEWKLRIPTNKPDVTRPADVAEEILRIYGYDNILFSEALHYQPGRGGAASEDLRNRLRTYLADRGGLEAGHNSIINGNSAAMATEDHMVRLANPLTAELNALRPRLLENGLESIAFNLNRRQRDLMLFELGRTYHQTTNGYDEHDKLGIWLTGQYNRAHWHSPAQEVDAFHLKGLAQNLLLLCGIHDFDALGQEPFQDEAALQYGLRFRHPDIGPLMHMGKVAPGPLAAHGIEQEVFFLEAFIHRIAQLGHRHKVQQQAISRFPGVVRDLALEVPRWVRYQALRRTLEAQSSDVLQNVRVFDVYQGDQIAEGYVSYALRLTFQDQKGTLKDKQIDKQIEQMVNAVAREHQGIIRK